MINEQSLSFMVENINLDVGGVFPPKEPILKFDLLIKNNEDFEIEIDNIRIKVTIAKVEELFTAKELNIKANDTVDFTINKKLNMFDFGNSVFEYFVKSQSKKYKIRGIAKVNNQIFHIKAESQTY
jgi:hypothetical protein